MVQMHQKRIKAEPIGGGVADDCQYTTWELKECPICERLALEHYTASLVDSVEESTVLVDLFTQALRK